MLDHIRSNPELINPQIIGAPGFFPTVWGWIKKWFDPITTSKIFILSSADMKKTLESFIDPANIPAKYGGELEFQFGDMPVLDPAYKDVLKFEGGGKDFPHGPMYWIHSKENSEMEALAVGTVNEKQRKEKVCTVKKLIGEAHLPVGAAQNGHAKGAETLGEDLKMAPTAAPSLVGDAETNPNVSVTAPAEEARSEGPVAVEAGELVPVSRPEPVSFVTANDGLNTLSLNEKPAEVPNGTAAVGEKATVGTDGGAPVAVLPAETVESDGKAVDEKGSEKSGVLSSLDRLKEKAKEKIHP
jgi:hypothetical protein